jgi:uncharacterized membrane protein
MIYLYLKWLHVLAAIVAVGSNITYGIWIGRASRNPEALPFTLRGIKLIDDRVANPSYGLLLITGLLMMFTVKLPLTTPWLLSALVLCRILLVVGVFGYTPSLRQQINFGERRIPITQLPGDEKRQGNAQDGRSRAGDRHHFLMVVKPGLWA